MKFDQFQTGVQTLPTCWAQQCCERLHGPKDQQRLWEVLLVVVNTDHLASSSSFDKFA